MMIHYIERILVLIAIGISVMFAIRQEWSPANYFLFVAALVDFEDWSHK